VRVALEDVVVGRILGVIVVVVVIIVVVVGGLFLLVILCRFLLLLCRLRSVGGAAAVVFVLSRDVLFEVDARTLPRALGEELKHPVEARLVLAFETLVDAFGDFGPSRPSGLLTVTSTGALPVKVPDTRTCAVSSLVEMSSIGAGEDHAS